MPALIKAAVGTKGTHICLHVAKVKPGSVCSSVLLLDSLCQLQRGAPVAPLGGGASLHSWSVERCFTEPSDVQALVCVDMSKRYVLVSNFVCLCII